MLCEKCGHELNENQVFCPKCGHERMLVEIYNPEDDFIINLEEKKEKKEEQTGFDEAEKSLDKSAASKERKETVNKKKLALILVPIILVIGIIIVVVFINNKNNNSFEYQFNAATEALKKSDYAKAIELAAKACKLEPDNLEAKWTYVDALLAGEDKNKAFEIVKEMITSKNDNSDIINKACEIFMNEEDYEHLSQILELCFDDKLKDKYAEYAAASPSISMPGGEFDHEIELEIKAGVNNKIYYTLDGTDPIKNGKLYSKAIKLDAGNYELRAVAKNSHNITSAEKKATFYVNPTAPNTPNITTTSGEISPDTRIEIKCDDDCRMFYTWDGSDPTVNSEQYTESLIPPKGNNILSVIAIDKYNQVSEIARKNFIVNEAE